jgi:glycosyltransferase involved in cell wall biosynthesis
VLTLGRISRVKRNDVLLEAMARLRELAPQMAVTCAFVGDPITDDCRAYLAELKARQTALGLDGVVEFRPGVSFLEAPQVMRQADIFVNSTDNAFDKAVLEALSCGLPLVTSNAGFVDTLPPPLRMGVVPPGDPDALARAIIAIAATPLAERERMAAAGRAFVVEKHSLARLTQGLMAEFRDLTGSGEVGDPVLSCEGP